MPTLSFITKQSMFMHNRKKVLGLFNCKPFSYIVAMSHNGHHVTDCVSTLQGIRLLLDNHLTHHSLSGVMPSLGDLFHDKVEKVRLEFVKLLLKIKHIRVFKVCNHDYYTEWIMCLIFVRLAKALHKKKTQRLGRYFI